MRHRLRPGSLWVWPRRPQTCRCREARRGGLAAPTQPVPPGGPCVDLRSESDLEAGVHSGINRSFPRRIEVTRHRSHFSKPTAVESIPSANFNPGTPVPKMECSLANLSRLRQHHKAPGRRRGRHSYPQNNRVRPFRRPPASPSFPLSLDCYSRVKSHLYKPAEPPPQIQ